MKTKKSGIVEELKAKHKKRLARAQQDLKRSMAKPGKRFDHYYYTSDILLFYKWAYRVGKGWYGFALGNVPRVWTDVLDEFLCWLEAQRPDFEIHQIKMKSKVEEIEYFIKITENKMSFKNYRVVVYWFLIFVGAGIGWTE